MGSTVVLIGGCIGRVTFLLDLQADPLWIDTGTRVSRGREGTRHTTHGIRDDGQKDLSERRRYGE